MQAFATQRPVISLACVAILAIAWPAGADEPPPAPAIASSIDELSWSEMAREIALSVIPENYRDDRHWDKTETVSTGVKLKTKHGRAKLEPKEKKVNHGFWRRVSASLLEPEKTLQVEVKNVRPTSDGATRFDLIVHCRVRCETQFALWTYGVKGINGSVESDVTVRAHLDASMQIASEFKPDSLVPVFVLRPTFHDLDLSLTDVDTRKIGLLGGWVADELGNATRSSMDQLLKSQEKPLLERMRKTISKKPDRLKLNPADAAKLIGLNKSTP